MKRSECIRIIELELHKRLGSYFNTGEFTKQVATKILDKIESRGMLPPSFFYEPVGVINAWEPEDE